MARRVLPTGLRTQVALAIAVATAIGIGGSFLAVYRVTGSRLRAQIDSELSTQVLEWQQLTAHADLSSAASLTQAASQFIATQRYHAESLLIVVQVAGGGTVSNDPALLAREEAQERRSPEVAGLLESPAGLTTTSVVEAGGMRVLTTPIKSGNRTVGTLRVANPLTPVQQAQSSLQHAFLIVGAAALLVAIATGIGLSGPIAAPLRRMARVAAAVSAGELSLRTGTSGRRGEVAVLSDAFDHMLDRLERAFKRQRDFVSDASHELRTPLAVLRAQVELLDRETDARARHDGTAVLLRRLDELDRLVGDMLTLASAEAGQLIEPESIDLHDFFEDLRRDLPLFGERDFQLQAVDGTLQADPGRLTQVLRNLIRNAVAHTRRGDRVTVVGSARDHHLQITVSDTGPGIPPDELERIFERFHRADASRSRDRGGSGLGLAIVRALVEAHGGSIRAESIGHGATFRIDLPGYESSGAQAGSPVPERMYR